MQRMGERERKGGGKKYHIMDISQQVFLDPSVILCRDNTVTCVWCVLMCLLQCKYM